MDKPGSLRAALVAALPEYADDPAALRLFVDKGRLVSRLTPGLGYEWRYTLRVELQDCQRSPDEVAIPLLLWLREHQPERLADFASDDALGFAADLLDETTWDLAWAFELTEAVTLAPRDGGGWQVTHLPEASLADIAWATGLPLAEPPVPLSEIWLGDRRIA